jgi:tyrosine-protein kinase Etk/Wzc
MTDPLPISSTPITPLDLSAAAGGTPKGLPSSTLTPSRRAWVENLTIVLRHKALIITVTLIVTAAVGVYAFVWMPNYYKATAVILPARNAGGALSSVTSGIASSLKDLGVAKLHGGDDSYTPLSLMQSRELKEKIIHQFGFIKIYKAVDMEDALELFSGNLDGEVSDEGPFTVSFEDTDPARAAAVTNAVIDAINDVNSRLAVEEAKHNVTYAQARYDQNIADLDSAERALGVFQRKYGVYSLPDQAKAELSAMAELEQQKYVAEINLQNAQQLYGSNASEAQVYRNTIEQIASKIGEMRAGMDAKATSFVPTNVMPDVALEYLRRMREVEIQSKLKAFLLPAYEEAKLDQQKLLFGFVILDRAETPVKKSRPHRSVFLLGALISSIVLTSVVVIAASRFRQIRQTFKLDQTRIGI